MTSPASSIPSKENFTTTDFNKLIAAEIDSIELEIEMETDSLTQPPCAAFGKVKVSKTTKEEHSRIALTITLLGVSMILMAVTLSWMQYDHHRQFQASLHSQFQASLQQNNNDEKSFDLNQIPVASLPEVEVIVPETNIAESQVKEEPEAEVSTPLTAFGGSATAEIRKKGAGMKKHDRVMMGRMMGPMMGGMKVTGSETIIKESQVAEQPEQEVSIPKNPGPFSTPLTNSGSTTVKTNKKGLRGQDMSGKKKGMGGGMMKKQDRVVAVGGPMMGGMMGGMKKKNKMMGMKKKKMMKMESSPKETKNSGPVHTTDPALEGSNMNEIPATWEQPDIATPEDEPGFFASFLKKILGDRTTEAQEPKDQAKFPDTLFKHIRPETEEEETTRGRDDNKGGRA